MKLSVVLSVVCVAFVALTSGSDAKKHHHHHHHKSHHTPTTYADDESEEQHVQEIHVHSISEKRIREGHVLKETPWDADNSTKTEKCADFCELMGFWEHQKGRNCFNRPTSLCMNYKLGLAGLEAVVTVAGCECTQ